MVALASSEESLPNTVLEAGSAGRPVVATRVGGVPEIVVDGRTGTLVPPLRSRAMADALVGLLEDPGAARTMGEAARARVNAGFTMDRELAETLDFYGQVLGGRA